MWAAAEVNWCCRGLEGVVCVCGGGDLPGSIESGPSAYGGGLHAKKKMMLAGHKVISQVYYSISFDIS
jgi:xanthine dehydrogenase molybdopterin-binding subunit B